MALGFVLLDGTTTVCPDVNLQRTSTPRVLKSSFGDGYELRAADGINNINETFSVSFNNRTDSEIDDIVALFASYKGVTAFNYTYPDTNAGGNEKTIKVVCDNFTQTYVRDGYGAITASFRKVFEA